ncbi:MAG: hypothetical protein HZB85_03850 [Deltaproteobacteria bacterium]|nr:hypothetical protein [Deltaproteobacteria bacterium]
MGKKDLEEFIEKKSIELQFPQVDWESRKAQWIESIKEFYAKVSEWLKPFGDKIKIDKTLHVELNDEYFGRYVVQALELYIFGEKVTFKPIGSMLIGAKGRIDMIGPYATVRFVYVEEDVAVPKNIVTQDKPIPRFEWKIATDPPKIRLLRIDEDSFSDALLKVIGQKP